MLSLNYVLHTKLLNFYILGYYATSNDCRRYVDSGIIYSIIIYQIENLLFAAQTRLPDGMSDNLRRKQVNAIIDVLGLKGKLSFVGIAY
jgi:hypothetical protein